MEKRGWTRRKPIPIYSCEICNENMFGREKDCSRRRFCRPCLDKRKGDNHETFCCAVCGKEVTRRKHHKGQFKAKVCSRLCQQKWRASVLHGKTEANWSAKRLVKLKAKAAQINERHECMELAPFSAAINRFLAKHKYRTDSSEDAWQKRIRQRLSYARPSKIENAQKLLTNSKTQTCNISRVCAQINAKVKWFKLCAWEKKIVNKLSNGLKRVRVKNDRQKECCIANQTKARSQWIQMRFNWVEFDA